MDKRRSLETLEKRRDTETKKLDEMKAKMLAARKKPKRVLTEMDKAVKDMAVAYEDALEQYKGCYIKVFPVALKEGGASYKLLQRAVGYAEELGVDKATYIKALFYMSDKWGNRSPKVHEIASFKSQNPAKERVKMYLAEVAAGDAKKDKKVVGPVTRITVPQSVKSNNSERQLRTFMRNYAISEEEVYKKFAKGSDAVLYFDRRWLMTKPVYLQLLRDGVV